jgi:hypothetical protein
VNAPTRHRTRDTLTAMAHLAVSHKSYGRWNDAARLEEEVLDTMTKLLGNEHRDTLRAMANLGASYRNLGRLKAAAKLEENVLAIRTRIFGEGHYDTLTARSHLALTYKSNGHLKEAVMLQDKVYEAVARLLGPSDLNKCFVMFVSEGLLSPLCNFLQQLNGIVELPKLLIRLC